MTAFIQGPLCEALSEEGRGILWYHKEIDILEDYPEKGDADAIAAHCERWELLFRRPMPSHVRRQALVTCAAYLEYAGKQEAGQRSYKEAAALEHANYLGYCIDPSTLRYLTYRVVQLGEPDESDAFSTIVIQECAPGDNAWYLLVRAAGHRFGLWGFELREEDIDTWLDRAAQLILSGSQTKELTYRWIEQMWAGGHAQAAEWLAGQLASRDVAEAMFMLSRIYGNHLYPDTPAEKVDLQLASRWLKSSADAEFSKGKLELALNIIREESHEIKSPQLFETVYRLLKESHDAGELDARVNLLYLLVPGGSEARQKWAHDVLVPQMIEDPDPDIRLAVAQRLVCIYRSGSGAPLSYALANAWAVRALELEPNDAYCREFIRVRRPFTLDAIQSHLHDFLARDSLRKRLAVGEVYAPAHFKP